jgi:hypothetical protein
MGDRCPGETRFKPLKYESNHTVRCQLDAGHEGMHLWKQDVRTVYWGGDAKLMESDTRYRYGLRPS